MKELSLNHTIPTLFTLRKKPQENIVKKGENAGTQHFLLFPECFLSFLKQILIFKPQLICCLQMLSIRTSLNFVVWHWVDTEPFSKQALIFKCLHYNSFENTVEKGEIAHNEQFLLFPQHFLQIFKIFGIFIKFEIVVCKFFQFRRI